MNEIEWTEEDEKKLLEEPEDTAIKEQRSGVADHGFPIKTPQDAPEPTEAPAEPVVPVPATQAPLPATQAVATVVESPAYKTTTTGIMNPTEWLQMKAVAREFLKSGALPEAYKNESQIVVALQAGREMGMKPFEAIQSLYFVHGSLNIWGKATMRRLREHGWAIKYHDENDEGTSATVTKGDETYTETYTYSEAVKSGYTTDNHGREKVGWKPGLNRKLKLRYGVLSLIIKSYIPEVLGSAANIVEVQEDAGTEPAADFAADEAKLRAAGTADELKAIYLNLPGDAKMALKSVYDERKAAL